ncbi:integral membrane protein [Pseudonocardia sp. Ae406_Ps2]|uniref:DedA family protein n=1 Tax=unclassified Pseudonocardia TaxID=2619320 RepID=UPI000317F9E4|nr:MULTISPECIES: VTT domain-containing protein [unclassified Pseudonocardia]OLL99801.1 integral membrane protein [Pseudonocardia sp. Ae331_Ps2]OLM02449.1 integral membrane protein [Pseudonocardia sp. Ae406_Ps2]OLM24021.1 integral membrane protein [Pseudonocardia sp. Ae706_Ps2]
MSALQLLAAPAQDWLEAELSPDAGRIAYLVVAGGVLLGSVLPVVPTGAIVGAAAATAMTSSALSLPVVLLLAFAAALLGDLVTFAVARLAGDPVRAAVAGGRLGGARTAARIERMRGAFAERGWLVVLVGRVAPAGRVPTLIAAAVSGMTWAKLVPAVAAGAVLWTLLYGVLGVLTGNLTDSPVVAALLAVGLVAVVAGVTALAGRVRSRLRARHRVG